ncbi:MAG: hypothetical protein RLZZ546_953 [Bacteroidota bacterium]
MILVTKSFLPSKLEYEKFLGEIWESGWLTNRGTLVQRLEDDLRKVLGVNNILLMNNGTVPLQIALKLLAKKKQVITTPFSYVATVSSIVWEGFEPIFVDIDENQLTIDENKIEAAISEDTGAILATHVYGNPCNVGALENISKKYNIPIIYDGAHAFGVKYKDESIFNYGSLSTCSFHATKLFHTGEGGAVFCNDPILFDKVFYSHNFGHDGPLDFHGVGINAKMSELSAAMGLSVLPSIDSIISERRTITESYDQLLRFSKCKPLQYRDGTKRNYSYYPILFESEALLLRVQEELNLANIFPRRYFYPSLNTLPYVKQVQMPVSDHVSKCVLCLPLYVGLATYEVEQIASIVNKTLSQA